MRRGPRSFVVGLLVAFLTLIPVASTAAEQVLAGHGVDVADMDLRVDPGADFYRYANGGWLDRTSIPPDYASIETMSDLEGRTRYQLVQLLTARAGEDGLVTGSDEWKAVRLFQQGVDLETRNAQGVEPIQPILDQIDAIDDLTSLHQFLQSSIFLSVPGFFFVNAAGDLKDSAQTVAYLRGPSLGLPNRDYYVSIDTSVASVRARYVDTGAKLLAAVESEGTDTNAAASDVYDLERQLASQTFNSEEANDLSLVYHPATRDDLARDYPLMDWDAYFAHLGLSGVTNVIVVESRYMKALDGIIRQTPLRVIKDYLKLQLLFSSAANLSESLESTTFAYFGTALAGMQVQAPIEGRTLDQVSHFLGDALGKLYVKTYFPPEAKARSEEMVQGIVDAYRHRLENNSWMTDETKANALAKLAKLRIKVGYPDDWQSYADVEITDSYFGSALSAFNDWYRHSLSQIGQPVDREAWPFPPQTVNAMYNPLNNEIIIPAGVLQAPLFDAQADPASNFGAIGYIVGHEITHGFDMNGSQFDADGNLKSWWTDEDRSHFEALNQRLAEQYSAIEVAGGLKVNGQQTLVENVADLGGIQVAYDALETYLTEHPSAAIQENSASLSQEQRFFIAAATVWRAEIRDEALVTQVRADSHAPASVRATQPLRNCDAFYQAFDIAPGDPMYLPPSERVVIW
jgi:putative endopeptidase